MGSIYYRRQSDLLQNLPATDKVLNKLVAENPLDNLSRCFGACIIVITETRLDVSIFLARVDKNGVRNLFQPVLKEFSFDGKIFFPVHLSKYKYNKSNHSVQVELVMRR